MPSIQVSLRNTLKSLVDSAKPTYTLPTIITQSTYSPRERLEDLVDAPKVKFVALGFSTDRIRLLRDASAVEVEIPVQIAIQQKIEIDDTAAADNLVFLTEQIMGTVETDIEKTPTLPSFSWLRTEPLRDENGLAYSYQQLINNGIFQSIFTVFFKHIKQVA